MKKINIVFMSILTLVLSSVLAACTFKKAEASFSTDEVVVSMQNTVNLDDYLKVEGLEKNDIVFKFSNSSLFEIQDRQVKAIESGKSFVYATYKNNNLSSMQIVVREKFSAPVDFSLSESGLLSWNVVSKFYGNDQKPTVAQSYIVEGYREDVDLESGESVRTEIAEQVFSNNYQLGTPGIYTLSVSAEGTGYFDNSDASEEKTFYYGFMPQLMQEDLFWDSKTGVLSWNLISGAEYKIRMDEVLLDDYQQTNSKDLKKMFEVAQAKEYTLSVVVFDVDGQKLAQESEEIVVTKLATPIANYKFSNQNGGEIEITTNTDVEKYDILFTDVESSNKKTISYDNVDSLISTYLTGLEEGIYDVEIVAVNESGYYFNSNALEFGKIYKMGQVSISGQGENDENGTIFKANVSSSNGKIMSKINVLGLNGIVQFDGITVGENSKAVQIEVATAGKYSLSAQQIPNKEENEIDGMQIFAINSDISSQIAVTKLPSFSELNGKMVGHDYVENKSVLTFNKVENAKSYELQYNNSTEFEIVDKSKYTILEQDGIVKFVFNDKVENEFVAVDNAFEFKIVAKTENDKLAINSSTTKTLILLSAPISAGSGNSTNKTYAWNASNNADSYRLEIYEIDKEIYEANKTAVNIDVSTLTKVEVEETATNHTFDKEGYYYVKIFAISKNTDQFISSVSCMEEVFYISDKLQAGTVSFGYDENYQNHSGFTESSGYFLKVANSENVSRYEISVSDGESGIYQVSTGSENVYLLSENFSNAGRETTISVVGRADDETLYEASDAENLTVERLSSVTYSNMEIDNLTNSITLQPKSGVTGIEIWQNDGNYVVAENGENAIFDISNLSNFSLKFDLFGSKLQNNIFAATNGKVYLDSESSVYNFSRLQSPNNLKYYNGNLTFDHVAVSGTEYYVLDLLCDSANGTQTKLSIRFDKTVVAVLNGTQYPLAESKDFVTFSGNQVEIKLNELLDIIKTEEKLAGIYNQAVDIKFSVWAYQNRNDGNNVVLSSPYATVFGDNSQTALKVEKMSSTILTFTYTDTDYTLSWQAVDANASVASETKYQVYKNNETFGDAINSGLSYSFASSTIPNASYVDFYVKTTNPYYLESNDSNLIKIYKLRSIPKITLSNDGAFSYEIYTSENDFYDYVEVNHEVTSTQNKNGKVDISSSGTYVLKVKGKTIENSDSVVYYIDSEASTFTLSEMETIKPDDSSIDFTNNLLSWNAFGNGKSLSSLLYVILFKDADGGVVKYTTADTSINFATNTELFNSVSALKAGDISIGVSAFLDNYSVVAGGTMYYASSLTLLDGKEEFNHYLYQSDKVIKKLTTPKVEKVEYVYTGLGNAQFPNIEITFTGNYGQEGRFNIFLNGTVSKTLIINAVEEKYTFTLTKEDYNNTLLSGETLSVEISALSDVDIPSSSGKVDIVRVVDLQSVGFELKNEELTQTLVVGLDSENLEMALGGLVLKIDYQPNGEDSAVEYMAVSIDSLSETFKFDMTEFFKANLSNGGTIKVTAYINNYANDTDKIYYLSAPVVKESETYNVLNQVLDVQKQSGGFVIDSLLNSDKTKYIVSYGASRFEVSKENGFYFEFPDVWANGSYDLTIYATEELFVNSVSNIINFNLNRLGSVSSVVMSRLADDLSAVNLSWNSVSGASAYKLKMFARTDVDKQNCLFEFNGDKNTYSLIEIFGKNYQTLLEFGKVSAFDLLTDFDVVFEVIAVGDLSSNNSQAFEFYATIKGNALQPSDISVDEFGRIIFNSVAGVDYLYRFVGADGTELQPWKTIKAVSGATKLEAKNLETGSLFNVEIIAFGSAVNEPASSADSTFVLDSIPTTTVGNDLTFVLNEEIINVGFNESLPSLVSFTLVASSFDKLYAGLDENAINTEDLISFEPMAAMPDEGDITYIYAYNFYDLVAQFREKGINISTSNAETSIYFWSYKQTADVSGSYVISKAYKFTFKFLEEAQFNEIKKMGKVEGNPNYEEDDANTFVLFNNTDSENVLKTLGFYVKISQIEGGEGDVPFVTTKFVPNNELLDTDYFYDTDKFAINLTRIFENDDLLYLTGKFKIEFAKIQVETVAGSDGNTTQKYIFSDWMSENAGKEFIFTRLPEVKLLSLKDGNLYWTRNGEDTTKYYVYFIQDLNGEVLGEKYAYFSTINTYYNASDFVSTEEIYYLAVQSISEDPYMISSKRTFVVDASEGSNSPVAVYKNQINSKMELKNGKFVIDWDTNGDFYKLLTDSSLTYAEIAEKLGNEMFTSPFTFSLKQLVENNVTLRVRLTSINSGAEGIRKAYDINAKYLLTNLYDFGTENGFDIKARLAEIYANSGASSTTTRNTIFKFIELVENGSYGIANYKTLFDDCFEAVQTGNYKLEYSLVGNNKTLNSAWYSFQNANNENILYVNEEPSVRATKTQDETDRAINKYKIIIKKSKIWNYVDGQYIQQVSDNYVLKIYNSATYKAFAITKGIDSYSLSLLESDIDKTVSVYESNAAGEKTIGGDYLMVYINFNDGDSILGTYGDTIEKITYQMQIYAVGNNYSASSKSENFSLTLLGFGNSFAVTSGVFSWTPHANRNTSVIYKKNTSSSESLVEVDGSMAQSRFSLDKLGNGLYDYVKFVTFGEIRNKAILVDSEIYQIDNVYKLAAPTLTNDFGYIGIVDRANIVMLENCYSDVNLYNYMLYNDVSTVDSYITFTDDNKANSTLNYEAGTTRLLEGDADYLYKQTEEKASMFYVASLGTTAGVKIEEDADNYYLRKILCLDVATGESTDKRIAVRSQFASLNAKMLDRVTNLRIVNGVLNWNEINGREEDSLTLPNANGADIVYKVSLSQYKISNTENGEVDTNVGPEYYYYTTNNFFDFTTVEEDKFVVADEVTYLKVYVQALALNVTERQPSNNHIELVEGGFAYGNLQFDGGSTFVLMSNGDELKKIDRLAPVDSDSLEVVDGSLYWKYTTKSNITEENFFENFSFVVVGKDDKQIGGQFSVTLDKVIGTENIFRVKFIEDVGAMTVGTQLLKVYATQGNLNTDVVIKSFAREIEVTKLRSINVEDFEIVSDSTTETLDLSKYFVDSNANNVVVTVEIVNGEDRTEKTLQFNKNRYKMFILRNDSDVEFLPNPKPVGYIDDYIVVKTDYLAKLRFKVNNTIDNTIYSDLSDEYLLQRSSWGENGTINWDEEKQEFNWVYDGYYALSEQVLADNVEYSNVLIEETVLYNDSGLSEASSITLSLGDIVVVECVSGNSARINYEGNSYYISASSFERQLTKVAEETIFTTDTFKIIEKADDYSLVLMDSGKMFRVETALIVEPVYIVEATYGEAPNQIVRTYQTTQNTFAPTIVGQVRLKVRIKLGNANIQSMELIFSRLDDNGLTVDYVDFNLFESGRGTSDSPYLISTNQQFKNMEKRMTKASYLLNYIENNREVTESEQYYFSLQNDLMLSENGTEETYLEGVMFKGEFQGILEGNNHTITYISKGVSSLSKGITVAVGNVLGPGNETSMTFTNGTSIFENLASISAISNLNLDLTYASATIPNHSLMAGLTLSNSGKIENVNLTNFKNGFIGYRAPNERTMMIYSGIASINVGSVASIIDCKVSTNMELNDSNFSQLIFVSGIVYTNYATIESCEVGRKDGNKQIMSVVCNKTTDTVQVAGIAITNNSSATIKNCSNFFDISVEGTNASNQIVVYIAGIVDLGSGTMTNNVNNGNLNTINIGASYLYKGDIAATTR